MAQTFRLNTTEFNRNANAYAIRVKRSLPEAINRKMAWINRKALWYTPKADYLKMGNQLGQLLKAGRNRKGQSSKLTMARGKFFNSARTAAAPLLALIINARRGRKGLPGLQGKEMKKEFQKVFGARARSIGFLKSGWLPALALFRRFSGKGAGARGLPPEDKAARQSKSGNQKGGGKIATESRPTAIIWNTASGKRDHKQALIKYGSPALQRAYYEEVADLKQFLTKQFVQDAKAQGIRTR